MFLDLAKAFDCVDHGILLKKLTGYGICGGVHSWLRSFLCGRTQQVVLLCNFVSDVVSMCLVNAIFIIVGK